MQAGVFHLCGINKRSQHHLRWPHILNEYRENEILWVPIISSLHHCVFKSDVTWELSGLISTTSRLFVQKPQSACNAQVCSCHEVNMSSWLISGTPIPNRINFPSGISSYIPYKVWDEIIYPFLNFNDAAVAVQEWISNFILHCTGHMITYPCSYKKKRTRPPITSPVHMSRTRLEICGFIDVFDQYRGS